MRPHYNNLNKPFTSKHTPMKINNLIKAFLCFALMIGAAINADAVTKAKRKSTSKTRTTATTATVIKGDIKEYGDVLTFQRFTIKKGKSKISVDYPIAGDPKLVDPIRAQIVEAVTGKNNATLSALPTPDRLLTTEIKKYKSKEYAGMDGSTIDQDVTVAYKNDKVITIKNTGYEYAGGAHGMGWESCTTYLLEDGTELTYSMLPSFNTLKPYIFSSLAKEFEIPANQFSDYGINIEDLPQGTSPYINEKGVNFTYGEYEIGPYSLGRPTATIPLSKMQSLCSGKALKFF